MDEILLDRSDGVVTLTLNRPELKNAVAFHMWEDLARIFTEVSRREEDRVLVVTGSGGSFCAGAELSDAMVKQGGHPLNAMQPVNAAALALHHLCKPSIAKVNGDAVGAGMNLALGCDLIVAGEGARFSEIFSRRALSVDFGGTWLLPRIVGIHKAKELALFGDVIPAAEAERIGVVNRVVPDAELDAFVADWAKRLAEGPPLALQSTKRMLSNASSVSMAEALDAEATAQTVNLTSKDIREGVKAFFEKRPPKFGGK